MLISATGLAFLRVGGEPVRRYASLNGLTARPVESEQSGAEINYFQDQQFMRKQPLEKSLNKRTRTVKCFINVE
jgi:hypothetical protein